MGAVEARCRCGDSACAGCYEGDITLLKEILCRGSDDAVPGNDQAGCAPRRRLLVRPRIATTLRLEISKLFCSLLNSAPQNFYESCLLPL